MKRHIRYSREDASLLLLDQRRLPAEEKWFVCRRVRDVEQALWEMVVRGAPALGVVAGYGCCLAAATTDETDPQWREQLEEKMSRIAGARPTAVNPEYVVERMRRAWATDLEIELDDLRWMWDRLAAEIHSEDIAANKAMGRNGLELLWDGCSVLTHCNAGALATGGYGTALGVVRAAKSAGWNVRVVAGETRPFLQGARLTAYELWQDDIDVRVACDNAAAVLMQRGEVDAVLVGADRIAANGDTANKIGTYNLALLASWHKLPFYVAAPSSTFDLDTASGEDIPIETRPEHEVTQMAGTRITPRGVPVYNYAFDVTPAGLISAFITEKGLIRPPSRETIRSVLE
ncbi:MAG: S-methyl-5-thioribose-1-phosphate isomerase [Desulfohalobiaceae bacterium]|nr:S-methyl-5-thioribose-1-phosphate isomerase [Desulfohalobiaceae bacterium]